MSSTPEGATRVRTGKCPCVKRHSPGPLVTEFHHVLPLSWGGPDAPANLIEVCAQTHYNTHFILNEFVRQNGIVPRGKHQSPWPVFAYDLAVMAWHERDPQHPTPFWLPAHVVA